MGTSKELPFLNLLIPELSKDGSSEEVPKNFFRTSWELPSPEKYYNLWILPSAELLENFQRISYELLGKFWRLFLFLTKYSKVMNPHLEFLENFSGSSYFKVISIIVKSNTKLFSNTLEIFASTMYRKNHSYRYEVFFLIRRDLPEKLVCVMFSLNSYIIKNYRQSASILWMNWLDNCYFIQLLGISVKKYQAFVFCGQQSRSLVDWMNSNSSVENEIATQKCV